MTDKPKHTAILAAHGVVCRKSARELIRRCLILEARGKEITTATVIWRWEP